MSKKNLPDILTRKEKDRLINTPSKTSKIGCRNRALMQLMCLTGLRIAETRKLKIKNINLKTMVLKVVQGKGGRDRLIKISGFILEDLNKWVKVRPKTEYFFCTLAGGKLHQRYVQHMVERAVKKAKIKKHISPHSLRHYFGTNHYREHENIQQLKQILGHESIATTTIYISLNPREAFKSMEQFDI